MCRRVWRTVSSASSIPPACPVPAEKVAAGPPKATGSRVPAGVWWRFLEQAPDHPVVVAEEAAEPTLAVVVPAGGADRKTLTRLAEVEVGHRVVTGDRGVVDPEGRQTHVPTRSVLTEDVVVEDDGQVELVVVVDVDAPGGAVSGHVETPGRTVLVIDMETPRVGVVPTGVPVVVRHGRERNQPEAEAEGEAQDTGASHASQLCSP